MQDVAAGIVSEYSTDAKAAHEFIQGARAGATVLGNVLGYDTSGQLGTVSVDQALGLFE